MTTADQHRVTAPPAVPRATVRLQLHKEFRLDDARALVPHFAALGISHLYASPILAARPGSLHGYDIVDHSRLNPEIGDQAAFDVLAAELERHGMGLIVDFVPNHMGVGGDDNPWWQDVLEWGRASPYAGFFDIAWESGRPGLAGKVLLPCLGDQYGAVLEAGELVLKLDREAGVFSAWYWRNRLPIAPRDHGIVLKAAAAAHAGDPSPLRGLADGFAALARGGQGVGEQAVLRQAARELQLRLAALLRDDPASAEAVDAAVARFNGTKGEPASFATLHGLLDRQAYRVAYWRVATSEINYRRFFDINDLAGLRIEEPALFELSHQLIFRLIGEGKLHGLRLDHIDGLYDPAAYCRALQDRAAFLILQAPTDGAPPAQPAGRTHPFYLLVEKILARHERLPEDWPVDGTTGYEFANLVNGLFVEPRAERAMGMLYRRFIRRDVGFDELAIEAKRGIVATALASEFEVLAEGLHRIAGQSWSTRDFTLMGIRAALAELVAHFPVYRTYITERGASEDDRRTLRWALGRAKKALGPNDLGALDFLYSALSGELAAAGDRGYVPADVLRIARKFQQFTGPVTAKAVEDTAFYRYVRLVSLNEVGGEPGQFGTAPAAFHRAMQDRMKRQPHGLLALATHDHKRGADARVRISALSEMVREWRRRVFRWRRMNRSRRRVLEDGTAPGRNFEYLFYQTLVGAWPLDDRVEGLADRLAATMLKAVREAKRRTSWTLPNQPYEAVVDEFVRGALDPRRSALFLADVQDFMAGVARVGAVNGLAQLLLQATAPGVPDLYQGTEFWDLSLVDPDNRRPVDWDARRSALDAVGGADPSGLLDDWRDGRIKQLVLARALDLRRRRPALFAEGEYLPLEVTGAQADRVLAFARRRGEECAVVAVPCLVAPLLGEGDTLLPTAERWDDTMVRLPERTFRDTLTGAVHPGGDLAAASLFARLPLALLEASDRG